MDSVQCAVYSLCARQHTAAISHSNAGYNMARKYMYIRMNLESGALRRWHVANYLALHVLCIRDYAIQFYHNFSFRQSHRMGGDH